MSPHDSRESSDTRDSSDTTATWLVAIAGMITGGMITGGMITGGAASVARRRTYNPADAIDDSLDSAAHRARREVVDALRRAIVFGVESANTLDAKAANDPVATDIEGHILRWLDDHPDLTAQENTEGSPADGETVVASDGISQTDVSGVIPPGGAALQTPGGSVVVVDKDGLPVRLLHPGTATTSDGQTVPVFYVTTNGRDLHQVVDIGEEFSGQVTSTDPQIVGLMQSNMAREPYWRTPWPSDKHYEAYEKMRRNGTTRSMRNAAKEQWSREHPAGSPNPYHPEQLLTGEEEIQPDHRIPLRELATFPGVDELTDEQLKELAQLPENIQPMPATDNNKKDDRTGPALERTWRRSGTAEDMVRRTQEAQESTRPQIQQRINEMVEQNRAAEAARRAAEAAAAQQAAAQEAAEQTSTEGDGGGGPVSAPITTAAVTTAPATPPATAPMAMCKVSPDYMAHAQQEAQESSGGSHGLSTAQKVGIGLLVGAGVVAGGAAIVATGGGAAPLVAGAAAAAL